jgi:hypothetical protein
MLKSKVWGQAFVTFGPELTSFCLLELGIETSLSNREKTLLKKRGKFFK